MEGVLHIRMWDVADRVSSSTLSPSSIYISSIRSLDPTAEDSLNIALREIAVTARDGRVSQLEQVYIRGSMVRLMSESPA
jgi:hypothetical protein